MNSVDLNLLIHYKFTQTYVLPGCKTPFSLLLRSLSSFNKPSGRSTVPLKPPYLFPLHKHTRCIRTFLHNCNYAEHVRSQEGCFVELQISALSLKAAPSAAACALEDTLSPAHHSAQQKLSTHRWSRGQSGG